MSELVEVEDWYFTFGCGQEHAGHYVKITAPYVLARDWMFKKYGNHWSSMYSEDQYEDCIARWNYEELEHITEEPITVDATDINKPDEMKGGYLNEHYETTGKYHVARNSDETY